MSILIKGVEMPKDKDISLSITVFSDGLAVIFTGQAINTYERRIVGRSYKGEAVPVPTPHGRLVEERVAYDTIAEAAFELDQLDMDTVDKGLSCTPTVIESEEVAELREEIRHGFI